MIYASDYGFAATNTAAQNAAALALAFAALPTNGDTIQLPAGVFQVLPITITQNGVTVQGSTCFGTQLQFSNATGDCLVVSGASESGFKDLFLNQLVRRTSGYALVLGGGAWRPFADRIRIDYHHNGLYLGYHSEAKVTNIQIRHMTGTRGIMTIGAAGQPVNGALLCDFLCDNPYPVSGDGQVVTWSALKSVAIGCTTVINGAIWNCSQAGVTGAAAPSGIPGTTAPDAFSVEVADGTAKWKFVCSEYQIWNANDSYSNAITYKRCVFLNGGVTSWQGDSLSEFDSHPKWINLDGIESDHAMNNSLHLDGGEGMKIVNGWIGVSRRSNGVYVGPGYKGELTFKANRVEFCWANGMFINCPNGKNWVIANNIISGNSCGGAGVYHGMLFAAGVSYANVQGNVSGVSVNGNIQGYGIWFLAGAGNHNVCACNLVAGNVNGGVLDQTTGAQKYFAGNVA